MPEITLGKVLFYLLLVVSNLRTLLSVRLPHISFVRLLADLLSRGCLLSLLSCMRLLSFFETRMASPSVTSVLLLLILFDH